MSSPDWIEDESGTMMDLIKGKITMNQGSETSQRLIIDAKASQYPLQIGPPEDGGYLRFRVDWNGGIWVGNQSFDIGTGDDGFVVQGGTTAEYINSTGKITAGTFITAGSYISAASYINAGTDITASGDISAVEGTGTFKMLEVTSTSTLTGNVTLGGNITSNNGKAKFKNLEVTSTSSLAGITLTGNLTSANNNITLTNGKGTFNTLEVTSTSSFTAAATFKKEIKIGPIDDTSKSGTQEYYVTITAPNTLTKNLSMQKLEVTTITIDGVEVKVLTAPSEVTEVWALY